MQTETAMTSPANLSAHGYDLSTVSLLGAYPATKCPVVTRFKVLPPPGVVPAPTSPVLQQAFDAGNSFEDNIFAVLLAMHPEAELIPVDDDLRVMTAATEDAMDRRVPIILGGCLPADWDGRRTGKPDVLLLDTAGTDGGYLPIDVKLYTLFTVDDDGKATAPVATLDTPTPDHTSDTAGSWRTDNRKKAAFQLAHYWRMLQACGRASARGAFGGIIDANQAVVWLDLNATDATIQNKKTFEDEPITWLRAYDHEFEFRRDVAAHTAQIRDGAALEPKVLPVWIGECSGCEWAGYCRPELEERDHISLLSYMDYWQHRNLRLAGVTTRRQVAERDHFTAATIGRLSEPQLRGVLDDTNADVPLGDLWSKARSVQPFAAELAAEGTVTAGDLKARLTDPIAVKLGRQLRPAWIDQARASVLGTPLLARGFTTLALPEYDVEVDFDMENDLSQNVYMWGLLTTAEGVTQPYEVFDAYESDVDGSGARLEAEIFLAFWSRVRTLRDDAVAAGRTFQMFYWSSAELTVARRICGEPAIAGLPTVDEVEGFFDEYCTDLEVVLKQHFVTPYGTSVKVIAPIAGHTWDAVKQLADADDENVVAAGDVSMLKHRDAVESDSAEARAAATLWLRTYNEQDVIATLRVRAWMRSAVNTLPRADDEPTLP